MIGRALAAVIVTAVVGTACAGSALAHKRKVPTTISIAFATEAGVDELSGAVTAREPCEKGRKVTVFSETSMGGEPYYTSVSTEGGAWAVEGVAAIPAGFFYAKAAKRKFNHRRGRRHRSVCKPAFSDTIEVPPH